jgi:hypothetical protein
VVIFSLPSVDILKVFIVWFYVTLCAITSILHYHEDYFRWISNEKSPRILYKVYFVYRFNIRGLITPLNFKHQHKVTQKFSPQ